MKKHLKNVLDRGFQKPRDHWYFGVLFCCMMLVLPLATSFVSADHCIMSSAQDMLSQRGGWELVDSGVSQDLNNVFFICLNRGTVVGDEGVIIHSGDGGHTWMGQTAGVTENLYDVSYYGYFDVLAVGSSGTILYTIDSGTNWTIVQTGMMETYSSCQIINETVGVAVGVNAIFQPFFTRTNDGWNTWDSTSFYIEHDDVFYEGRLTDVCFQNTSVGFATAIVSVPAGGAIVRTTDGGSTWETVLFYSEALMGIDVTMEGIVYAVGDHGAILQSVDAGDNWQELDSGMNSLLRAVDFPNEMAGTVVGDTGVILRTENSGEDWIQQSSETTVNLLSVQYVTEKFGIVVGEQGVILRTQTGGYPDDVTPPETLCVLSGTLEGDVYVSDVLVTLNATDDFSGVATTMYQLDNTSWASYTEPFLVTGDGPHQVLFYSTDNAGNIEEEKTCDFRIQYPPNLQITLTGGFGVTVHVKNLGSTNLTNQPWTLSFEGGLILFGKQKTGVTDINVEEEITINALVFGVGKPTIHFTIASFEKNSPTTVFLFFVSF
jgi:photosystem II stability/assembly factor-like uncharacterized protein